MNKKALPPEIISLIHHVELNKSGWWDKAMTQVIRGVLWKAKSPITIIELSFSLKHDLGMHLTEEVLTKQLNSLLSQGTTIQLPDGTFKLTENAQQELTSTHNKATKEQKECQTAFLDLCAQHCPELDGENIWKRFTEALVAAIQVTGANLYHLLVDGNLERDIDWFTEFLSRFDPDSQVGLRCILAAFFAPENHVCRSQVLRLLSAHFFAEASQLRPDTLALIEGGNKKRSIKVVLDTNFIFSVLGLHDNPR